MGDGDLVRPVLLALLAIQADKTARRRVLLETPAAAAAAALGLVGLHVDVAHLAGRPVRTGRHLAVHDDACAHARAQRHHHEALRAVAGAHPGLAKRGGVAVVEHGDRRSGQRLAQGGDKAVEVERNVGRHYEGAGGQHDAGHVETHADELLECHVGLLGERAGGLGHLGERLGAVKHAGLDGVLRQHLAARRDHAHLDARPAHVDAENGLRVVGRRRRARVFLGSFCHGSPPFCGVWLRTRVIGSTTVCDVSPR